MKARVLVRSAAVLFLGAALLHGVLRSEAWNYPASPWPKLPGRMASIVGMAADDIQISGLTHHDSQMLLTALNISPGISLVGFDAGAARRKLEAMDWIGVASVQRKYPNRLEISVAERVPFAIWQHDGNYSLIDRDGVAMGGLELMANSRLPLVTGNGANIAAEQLVNQLSATPALFKRVSAAAYVGARRWNLYLDTGVKVELPADGVVEALKRVDDLEVKQQLLSKGITTVDMRIAGQMNVALAEIEQQPTSPPNKVKAK